MIKSSQNKKKRIMIIIITGFFLMAFSIGDTPADFTLPDLKGNKVTFPDEFKGKVVMVRFWTAMCHYCVREMPTIEAVYNKYKGEGFVVLAINVGQPKEEVEGFLSDLNISYPVLLDLYSVTSKKYGFSSSPTTYIIDRNNVIKEKIMGEVEGKAYEKIISGLL